MVRPYLVITISSLSYENGPTGWRWIRVVSWSYRLSSFLPWCRWKHLLMPSIGSNSIRARLAYMIQDVRTKADLVSFHIAIHTDSVSSWITFPSSHDLNFSRHLAYPHTQSRSILLVSQRSDGEAHDGSSPWKAILGRFVRHARMAYQWVFFGPRCCTTMAHRHLNSGAVAGISPKESMLTYRHGGLTYRPPTHAPPRIISLISPRRNRHLPLYTIKRYPSSTSRINSIEW